MFSLQIPIVILVVLFMIILLYSGKTRPIIIYISGVTILGLFGVISSKEILLGFANEQIAIILLLIIIGNIVHKAGIINSAFDLLFKNTVTVNVFLPKLMVFVSSFSAFFNNAPLVAMIIPYIDDWATKNNINQSKLLIPLSYAAILGGSATLIGTSTNLLINGMMIDAGETGMNIFEFSYVGVPMIITGIIYMLTVGVHLLPNRASPKNQFSKNKREYMVEVLISEQSSFHEKSVENAGLRNLKDLFLVEIIRRDYHIRANPQSILRVGDKLIFAGDTKEVISLIDRFDGLELPKENLLAEKENIEVVEVVVSPNSALQDAKVKLSDFRSRFDAAIIAVHRNGEHLAGKIGNIVLKAGDVLLLFTNKGFYTRVNENRDFYLISKIKEYKHYKNWQKALLLLSLIGVIVLSALKIIALFKGLLAVLVFILIFKIARLTDFKNALDLNLLGIAALSLALGKAIMNSGLADIVAENLIYILHPLGMIGLLVGLFIITSLIASYMTNITAVSIVFPIAYSIGVSLIADGLIQSVIPFALIVAYGASANYVTPVGYLTNIMVFSSGSYQFKDFLKVGFPLMILHMFMAVTIIYFVYIR